MKFKDFDIIEGLRDTIKPDWQEMLNPAKPRNISIQPYVHLPMITKVEQALLEVNETLVGKNILEAGCGFGDRCFLMAKYEGTKVHGIDVDEYTVDQSPDLNIWNPNDLKFIHTKTEDIRNKIGDKFPESIRSKVSFQTSGMENYVGSHDVIVSFDVLEHIIPLEIAIGNMNHCLKSGGIIAHEYNPFFSMSGGHSLCTTDIQYGHCRMSNDDFKEYVQTFRPEEEKIDLNFYNRCLNRASIKDIKDLLDKYGFEILSLDCISGFSVNEKRVAEELSKEILPQVQKLYPSVVIDDLLYDSILIIARKR